MHAELREKVARIIAPGAWLNCDQNGRAWAEQWTEIAESEEQADAILATLRDALLTDEVVEAGARGMTGARWEVGHRIVNGEKLGAKETARIESHATLSAACAVLLRALQTKGGRTWGLRQKPSTRSAP